MLVYEGDNSLWEERTLNFLSEKHYKLRPLAPQREPWKNYRLFRETYRGAPAWHICQNKATWQQTTWTTLQKPFPDIKSLWAVIKFCCLGSMCDVWADTERNLRPSLEGSGVFWEAERSRCSTSSGPLRIHPVRSVSMSFGFEKWRELVFSS